MKMSVVVENDATKKEFSIEVPGKITGEMIDAIGATIRREFGIPDSSKEYPQPITVYRDWYVYPYRWWYRDADPYPWGTVYSNSTITCNANGNTWTAISGFAETNDATTYSVIVKDLA